ncbi:MAG: hypothetical protein DI537_37930 [Stutzerimonas stutzeri]|nr:MAG: hypothetical protein DI537_37930 [Stutzerimonas stutzeri]
MLYQAGMVSRKHVEETLGLDALNTDPRATKMEWADSLIGGSWVVSFDSEIWVDSRYLDFINENISGHQRKGRDGHSWCFANKDDATLFLIRFK